MFPSPVEVQNAKAYATAGEAVAKVGVDNAVLEPKLDGWRITFYVDGPGAVRSYSRTQKPQMGKLPHIEQALSLLPAGTVIDGEILAGKTDDQGRIVNDFKWVAQVMGSGEVKAREKQKIAHRPLTFVAFDVIAYGGEDKRHLPLQARRPLLETIVAEIASTHVQLILQVPAGSVEAADALFAQITAAGYEGVMVKDIRASYASGQRGHGFYKIKAQPTADVVVMGFEDGKGKYSGTIGAVIFGQMKDGVLVERGRCSGMDDALRFQMGRERELWVGRVIEVAYMGITSGDCFRHPQFKRLRADRTAESCDWRAS